MDVGLRQRCRAADRLTPDRMESIEFVSTSCMKPDIDVCINIRSFFVEQSALQTSFAIIQRYRYEDLDVKTSGFDPKSMAHDVHTNYHYFALWHFQGYPWLQKASMEMRGCWDANLKFS
jgi:hypothetical protein